MTGAQAVRLRQGAGLRREAAAIMFAASAPPSSRAPPPVRRPCARVGRARGNLRELDAGVDHTPVRPEMNDQDAGEQRDLDDGYDGRKAEE